MRSSPKLQPIGNHQPSLMTQGNAAQPGIVYYCKQGGGHAAQTRKTNCGGSGGGSAAHSNRAGAAFPARKRQISHQAHRQEARLDAQPHPENLAQGRAPHRRPRDGRAAAGKWRSDFDAESMLISPQWLSALISLVFHTVKGRPIPASSGNATPICLSVGHRTEHDARLTYDGARHGYGYPRSVCGGWSCGGPGCFAGSCQAGGRDTGCPLNPRRKLKGEPTLAAQDQRQVRLGALHGSRKGGLLALQAIDVGGKSS
jgi:hypothetical protein